MRMRERGAWALALLLGLWGCNGTQAEPAAQGAKTDAAEPEKKLVGYDVRRLRPRNAQPLKEMFEEMFAKSLAEGKQVAVLFSAGWCEPCRGLELELGNFQSEADIGHVRVLELKEEDWAAVTRMNEFNDLRRRWYPGLNTYPIFVVLDEHGAKIEEMREAIERLTAQSVEPTVANWFRSVKDGTGAVAG